MIVIQTVETRANTGHHSIKANKNNDGPRISAWGGWRWRGAWVEGNAISHWLAPWLSANPRRYTVAPDYPFSQANESRRGSTTAPGSPFFFQSITSRKEPPIASGQVAPDRPMVSVTSDWLAPGRRPILEGTQLPLIVISSQANESRRGSTTAPGFPFFSV